MFNKGYMDMKNKGQVNEQTSSITDAMYNYASMSNSVIISASQ